MVAGFNPGGGRSGLDPRLDAIVVEAAERLRARYGIDVEIRFNSNRLSGGAFLNLPFSVGIKALSVSITNLRDLAAKYGGDADEDIARMGVDPDGGDDQIVLRVYVDATGLKDPTRANCTGSRPYMYIAASDLDDAIAKLDDAYDS
jgi:hypothetical protein